MSSTGPKSGQILIVISSSSCNCLSIGNDSSHFSYINGAIPHSTLPFDIYRSQKWIKSVQNIASVKTLKMKLQLFLLCCILQSIYGFRLLQSINASDFISKFCSNNFELGQVFSISFFFELIQYFPHTFSLSTGSDLKSHCGRWRCTRRCCTIPMLNAIVQKTFLRLFNNF